MVSHSLWLKPFGEITLSLEHRIRKLAESHGTPSFSPHITLLGGLQQPPSRLINLTDILAASLSPFEVLLTQAGTGDTFYRSLFVHVEKSEELEEVRLQAEKLFEAGEDEQWLPHLSLMYGDLDAVEKEKILNAMGREFHLRFPIHTLLLVKTEGPPEDWEEVHAAGLTAEQ